MSTRRPRAFTRVLLMVVLAGQIGSAQLAPPGPPRNLQATVVGNAVNLQWDPPDEVEPTVTGYVIEAGSTSTASDLAVVSIPNVTSFNATAPARTYYLRVRAVNPGGVGQPGATRRLDVGCLQPPAAPVELRGTVTGTAVTLQWYSPADNVIDYVVEAGSEPGASNLAVVPAPGNTLHVESVPPGRYYVRVRARSACGVSPASIELQLVIGAASLPDAPLNLRATVAGSNVTLEWDPPASGPAPSAYVVEAGSSPGASNLAVLPVGGATVLNVPNVPPGRYYIRVRAVAAGGTGGPSNEIAFSLPVGFLHTIACAPSTGWDITLGCRLTGNWRVSYDTGDDDDFQYVVEDATGSRVVEGHTLPASPITILSGLGTAFFKVENEGGATPPYVRLTQRGVTFWIEAAAEPAGIEDLVIRLDPIP